MMVGGKLKEMAGLRRLAQYLGVQTSYFAMDGARRLASPETLCAVLRAMGVPLERMGDAEAVLREQRLADWARRVEPVTVVWGKRPGEVEYYVPPEGAELPVEIELTGAAGETLRRSYQPDLLRTVRQEEIGGTQYRVKAIPLPPLPWGYHTLRVTRGSESAESMVISAPLKAYEPRGGDSLWGGFLPLYALRSATDWGAGDLGDFERLTGWVQGLGGNVVATLPLLAAFLDEPFDPSPYVPASRLFWNEFYIDIARVPELEHSPAARAIVESEETRRAIDSLRAAANVDYRGVMELKERVLRELAREFFNLDPDSPRRAALEAFSREFPKAGDYAAFRAACRARHGSWHVWPEPMKSGTLSPGDYDEDLKRYYLYAQFIVQEQMDRLSEKARENGPGLYLDLPLGVHSDSYDVWRQRDIFAWGVSGGSPPDLFFSKGQDWGFAPQHPRRMRQDRYKYLIEYLGRLMRQAGAVRIDHVMGLHRLFWVPGGMEATQGAYVQYPATELHAVLNVESHRWQSMVVGEDLGTVPGTVTQAMKRHNIHGMYVMQFCVSPKSECLVAPVPAGRVASMNTHDMPSFAGFWQGKDIDDQLDLGLRRPVEEEPAREERAATLAALVRCFEREGLLAKDSREQTAELPRLDLLRAALEFLGRSPAKMVLVNLEDLWQELRQQNVPGTCAERHNWQHKARYTLEEFAELEKVRELLGALDRARKKTKKLPDGAFDLPFREIQA